MNIRKALLLFATSDQAGSGMRLKLEAWLKRYKQQLAEQRKRRDLTGKQPRKK